MSTWPLMWRNKVEDSKVSVPVQRCTESENVVLRKAAQDVSTVFSFPFPFLKCALAPGSMEYTGDCLSDTQALEGALAHNLLTRQ